MDHKTPAKQLIVALRGKRSQVALSRRLRRKSNVLYTWESGRRFPTACVFFELCTRVGVDVKPGLAAFLGNMPEPLERADLSEPAGVAALLDHLREGTTLVELARRVGSNRVSVSRWMSGKAEPKLPEFLRLVDASSLRLLDFLSIFVSPAVLPEARAAWEMLEAQRRVAYSASAAWNRTGAISSATTCSPSPRRTGSACANCTSGTTRSFGVSWTALRRRNASRW